MAFREEIIARMGLDNSAFKNGLRTASSEVGKWAGGLKAQLAGVLTFGAVLAGFKKALDEVEKISLGAQALDVSTDFLQDIRNIGIASNISGEQIEKALDKFRRGLPEGANVEKEFLKFADGLAAIKDQGERARVAVDKFGERMGSRLLPILQKGSAGVRELAEEFSKFSRVEIAELEKAEAQIDKFSNKVTIRFGRVLAQLSTVIKAATVQRTPGKSRIETQNDIEVQAEIDRLNAETAADGTGLAARRQRRADEQKKAKLELLELSKKFSARLLKETEPSFQLAELEKERTVLAATRVKNQKEVIDRANKLLDLDIRAKDLKEKVLSAEEKITAEKKRQADHEAQIARASSRLVKAGAALDIALGDRSKFTLQELIERGFRPARQIGFLEERGRALRGFNFERSQAAFGRADEIRKAIANVLVSSEVDPFEGLRANVVEQTDALNELLRKSGEEGIIVQARSD